MARRSRQDETDGPGGFADSLKAFYRSDGEEPGDTDSAGHIRRYRQPERGFGDDDLGDVGRGSIDTTRFDSPRADEEETEEAGEDEGVLTDEELARVMRNARRSAEGEDEDEDETEDEDEQDGDGAPSATRMKITCPQCGNRFIADAPDGMQLVEDADDIADHLTEDEMEQRSRGVRATCAACSEKFSVAPPRGYRFGDTDEGEDDGEDEDEGSPQSSPRFSRAGERRRAAESLASAFWRNYLGKRSLREIARQRRRGRGSASAIDSFLESYRHSRRAGRDGALPS